MTIIFLFHPFLGMKLQSGDCRLPSNSSKIVKEGLVFEHQHCPVVALQGLADGEAVLFCHCRHLLHIVGEEAGEDEGALGGEVLDVGGQVGGEDVLVDVGDDGLELAFDG